MALHFLHAESEVDGKYRVHALMGEEVVNFLVSPKEYILILSGTRMKLVK